MAKNKLNLPADFPAVSTQEWMDKINADLKGADFDKKLVWKTTEGFNVQPFYRSEDIENLKNTGLQPGEFPYTRGTKADNDWYVRQNIDVKCPVEANKKALDLLMKGVNAIGFKMEDCELNAGFIAELLKGIDAEIVELNFNVCLLSTVHLANLLVDYFKSENCDVTKLQGSINYDPIKAMLLKGKDFTKETIAGELKKVVSAIAPLPFYRTVHVNAFLSANAGAYITQELGYALSWGNEYLSTMTDAGIDTAQAAKNIKFNFGIGSNYFMEIAKFRAARMLWAMIVDKYAPEHHTGECPAKMRLHAITSTFNMTIFDANVNMLRTQTEAMSATIAGVDSLTVQPYDITYKSADDFSERIARNQQLLLKEESHFDKVVDPSAGSYYIESLTESIAKEAWKIFLEIEEQGGFYEAVKAGKIQDVLAATSQARLKAVSSRREILLGTNQFPNFSETAKDKIETDAINYYCGCGSTSESTSEKSAIKTLRLVREAEEFEALRLATERSGKRPKVFMLTMGNLAMRIARAQFSSNFFACAGYEIKDNNGFKTVSEGIEAAKKEQADIVVLCSSDDEYATLAPEAHRLAKDNFIFVVAGAPASTEELKAQGIEHFINVKSNVLHTLQSFNKVLAIDPLT